jgi:small conductance mechanosensitive channel
VLLLAVVQVLGVPMTSMFAVLGAAGLAIGLALKDSLSNIASGVMLVTLRPFQVGDLVTINGVSGTVEMSIFRPACGVTIRSALPTADHQRFDHQSRRIRCAASTVSESATVTTLIWHDPSRSRSCNPIRASCANPHQCSGLRPRRKHGEPACAAMQAMPATCRKCELTEAIRTYDAAGVSFPFPQRDLHDRRQAFSSCDLIDAGCGSWWAWVRPIPNRKAPGFPVQRRLAITDSHGVTAISLDAIREFLQSTIAALLGFATPI